MSIAVVELEDTVRERSTLGERRSLHNDVERYVYRNIASLSTTPVILTLFSISVRE